MNREKIFFGIGLILQLLSLYLSHEYSRDPLLSWSILGILFSLGSLIIVLNGGDTNTKK
jgi:hypothetical protein